MFTLSSDSPVHLKASNPDESSAAKRLDGCVQHANWQQIQHIDPPQFAIIIKCFHMAVLPDIKIVRGDYLFLKFAAALPKISDDGLQVKVFFISSVLKKKTEIFDEHLVSNSDSSIWSQTRVSLEKLAGKRGTIEVHCGPGPDHIPQADWLALSELHICSPDQLTLSRARMHNDIRVKNETEHFAKAYKLPMFIEKKENAYTHASQIIKKKSISDPINFRDRILEKTSENRLDVLSLCCGSANLEAKLVEGIEDKVNLTLFDINEELLKMAATKFNKLDNIQIKCGNANALELKSKSYDIVICVSALHHIVELEKLVGSIAASLRPGGEFWSIGEYIGFEGARLWPESYEIANAIFNKLPERLRINHVSTESNKVDENIPNQDCSISTFEGIRSSEIQSILSNSLTPVKRDIYSTIAWRILDPAYVQNYDLDKKEDKEIVEKIANLDVEYLLSGKLNPVGMNAIFCR